MFPAIAGLGFAGPLALTTVSATIACGFMLAHYAGTRARLTARERERAFEDLLDGFLAGRLRGRELLAEAARLEPDLFWKAMDGFLPGIPRRDARDLEQTLERSRHVRAERIALREGSPVRRELAARRLAAIGARRHFLALRHAAVVGPETVSFAALIALARVRDEAALRWLLANPETLSHRPPRARLALLRAFGRRGTAFVFAALERGLREPRMERAVIEALALARHAEAAPLIARRLTHPWRDVRVAAARALGQLGAIADRDALAPLLEDSDWRVRAQAARALGRLAAVEQVAALRRALRDANWWVRHHAAHALAALGEDGRRVLREVEAGDSDAFARDIAAEALAGGFPGVRH